MICCPNELKVLDGKKSYCAAMDCWTNCREVSHCVAMTLGKLEAEPMDAYDQLALSLE